uniref:Sulfatase domain-containing protein n=1 Tax=Bursaphelenchus xylophilus TaxID=6326 RepID=A0A1I7SHA9_BURXY
MRSQGFNSTFRRRMYDEMCREPHEYQMDYFLDFINAYPDKPKFSINWFAYLAHDDTNALFHVDMYFQRFLRENKEKLSNSYLIVMGDHGNRYDKIRDTKLGEAEEKNPLLMVVVPRHLRANQQLWSNMKKNSKQLTTHYDTYATLVDIAHNSPFYNANSSFDGFKKPNTGLEIIGESYLHAYKLEKPRNCNNQRIPFDFCSCQFQQQDRSGDKNFTAKIANFLVDWINGAVERHNQSSICGKLGLHFETPIEVEEFEAGQHFNAFKVTVRLSPGGGRVWAYVQAHGELNSANVTFSLISERPARLDSYKEAAYCCKDTYVS